MLGGGGRGSRFRIFGGGGGGGVAGAREEANFSLAVN